VGVGVAYCQGQTAELRNLTITGSDFTIKLPVSGVAVGAGVALNGSTAVRSIVVQDTRLNVSFAGSGPCFGAVEAQGTGKSEVDEAELDGVELQCRGSTGGEVSGVRAFKQIVVRDSTLECEGPCVVGVDNVSIVRSAIVGATLGREIGVLRLESTTADCGNEASAVCIEAKEIVLAVNVTGKTGTRRFFNASKIALEEHGFVAVRYFAESENEGIVDWPALHFTGLSPPFEGRYAISTSGANSSRKVEMDGHEKGLLIVLDLHPPLVTFSRPLGHGGMIFDSQGNPVQAKNGETIVDKPRFVSETLMFTSSVSPYTAKRHFFHLSTFLFAMLHGF
jgi:hypothetical protein